MSVSSTALIVVLVSLAWVFIPRLMSPDLPAVWGGHVHKDFKQVEQIFSKAVQDGRLKGGSIAAYYKGELVVNLWGGYADLEAERPWNKDTITTFYSTTKMVGAIVVAQMVDKGLLDYQMPVCSYWPEFCQNGKDKITVETLISHQAGLAQLDETIKYRDLIEKRPEVEAKLARQKPSHEPGTAFGYHAVTFGLYVDTLVKKVDPKHRNMSQIFQEDIAKPFGIDFYVGVPKQFYHRMARSYPGSLGQTLWSVITSGDLEDLTFLYKVSSAMSGANFSKSTSCIKDWKLSFNSANDPDKAAVGLTSFNGQGTARGLAKLCSILSNGGSYKGKQLLSPKRISDLGTTVFEGTDILMKTQMRAGPGTILSTNPKGETIFGHPGFGAQMGFVDPHTRLSFAFSTNYKRFARQWHDSLQLEMRNAIYDAIESRKKK